MISPNEQQSRQDVASHYDALDSAYRELWGEHVHHGFWTTGTESDEQAVKQLIHHVARKIQLSHGQKVVDIGCGYGATSRFLETQYQVEVTGLTVSNAQFEYATTKYPSGARILLQDWMTNTFDDESFDAAIAIESLGHMEDKARFFGEALRVLKPGGHLGVCAWLSAENPKAIETRYLLEPIVREGRLPSMGSGTEYQSLMKTAGFDGIEFEDISSRVKKTWSRVILNFIKAMPRDSQARKIVLNPTKRDRIFAKTLFTIWTAFQTGSMRYGVLTGTKPR